MEITLIDLPKISTNKIYAGVHWTGRKHQKDLYLMATKYDMKKIEKIKSKVDLEFTFYFKSRVLDSSNCSYMGKLLEDCLVAHGVLQDDTIKYVGKVSYQSLKGSENKTIIKIITQDYKGLGNSFTVPVIKHLIQSIIK
jgi:hypothetical protein